MIYCENCGKQLEENARFCTSCGTSYQTNDDGNSVSENHEECQETTTQPEPTTEEKLQQATATIDAVAQKLGNTTDHTSDFSKTDIEANKGPALLSYFGLLVLIPIFAAKHSPYARYHANQGLVLFVGMLVWAVIDGAVTALLRALLGNALGLWGMYSLCGTALNIIYAGFSILAVIGIINVLNERAKELPIIGKYKILK